MTQPTPTACTPSTWSRGSASKWAPACRVVCKEPERATILQLQRALSAHLGAENGVVEEFSFADGFPGSLPTSGVLLLTAALLNAFTGRVQGVAAWLTASASLGLAVVAIVLVVLEFLVGYELIDSLLPQRQAVNVIGTQRRPGTETATRLLLVSGHHEGAPENTWLGLLGSPWTVFAVIWGIRLFVAAMSCVQLVGVLIGNPADVRDVEHVYFFAPHAVTADARRT